MLGFITAVIAGLVTATLAITDTVSQWYWLALIFFGVWLGFYVIAKTANGDSVGEAIGDAFSFGGDGDGGGHHSCGGGGSSCGSGGGD